MKFEFTIEFGRGGGTNPFSRAQKPGIAISHDSKHVLFVDLHTTYLEIYKIFPIKKKKKIQKNDDGFYKETKPTSELVLEKPLFVMCNRYIHMCAVFFFVSFVRNCAI